VIRYGLTTETKGYLPSAIDVDDWVMKKGTMRNSLRRRAMNHLSMGMVEG
jgi:hypothetical protein